MKRKKEKKNINIKKLFNNLVDYLKKIKKDHLIKKFIKDNPIFIVYLIVNVFNSTILRFFTIRTVENYLSIKPIIADLAIITIVGSFNFLFKTDKSRNRYLFWFTILFTATCMINSVYYTFYTSYASFSMLSLTQYIGDVGDAVVENVLQLKDLIYLIAPITLFVFDKRLKRKKFFERVHDKNLRKQTTIKTLVLGIILAVIFTCTLTSLEIGRFTKQWNKEYIVMKFGIYLYQINDGVTSLKPKINSMFGLDEALRKFNEYYEDRRANDKYVGENEYTNIFKGKNVLVLHAESLQNINIGLEFNGEQVAPNFTRLAKEGLYFSNYYSQVSVGTSSDAELTFNTSLMPTQSGTAFVSYFDREYIGFPKILGDNGYYTFSMHGNNADFWNRRVMHENLGFKKFYAKKDYDVNKENMIGLGISDKAFFSQSADKIAKIKEKYPLYYGVLISLSNHTPFSDVDKYGEFPVDIKETVNGQEISHPYMEGTKLGNYFKSVHYADEAFGEFINALDEKGLLENTVIVVYGDHDARLPEKDYVRLFNYDKDTDTVRTEDDPEYHVFDSYQYELNRKVPFIIWTKDKKLETEITDVMGMYDATPTLANMLGVKHSDYILGHDIFNIKDNNIVVFPNGNWVTNKVYYNSQKSEYLALNTNEVISNEYINNNIEYANKLLDVSNDLIVYDLIKKSKEKTSAK